MLRKIGVGDLRKAVARVARNEEHERGLTYTDGEGRPVCIIGRVIADITGLRVLPWPEELQMSTFMHANVQAHLVVTFRLELTDQAITFGNDLQARADDGVDWKELV